MDSLIFYIALFVHLTSLVVGFGSVIVIDTFGLLWLLKKTDLMMVTRVANVTQRLIWTGWMGLVLSGLILITAKGFVDNLTLIKLFFVVMLGLNGLFLDYIKRGFDQYTSAAIVPVVFQFRIGLASAVSQTGWWGAFFIGFLHRHWRHYIPWPENPWLVMAAIGGLFFVIWIMGERKFRI